MTSHQFAVTLLALFVAEAWGHGMVMDPPNRSSLWRFDPDAPINYNDNENFCGGYSTQWLVNNGSCGVCGDDVRLDRPRPNENTGTYGQGKISATYEAGSVITVKVLITANHWGYFNFSICNIITPDEPETVGCFEQIPLADGKLSYYLPSRDKGYYNVDLQLPAAFTCEQCVLRWHWNTGNTWGLCEDGSSDIGCGPQETFMSCSDIAIV
ncbi:uncharacterized protein CBL_03617 [Carabus blaptoides fortunei]